MGRRGPISTYEGRVFSVITLPDPTVPPVFSVMMIVHEAILPVFSNSVVLHERSPGLGYTSVVPEDVLPEKTVFDDPVLVVMLQDEVDSVSTSPVVVEPEEWIIIPVNVSTVPELVEPVDTGVSVDPVDDSILPVEVTMISSVHVSSVNDIVMTTLSF